MMEEDFSEWFSLHYLHLYHSISLKQSGLGLGIKHKGISTQSHHAIMTLRIQRHKQMDHTDALTWANLIK